MAIRPPAVSWMDEVTSTDVPDNKTLNLAVWGEAKTGKTRFIGTAPKPLIIAAEDGTLTLRDKSIPMIPLDESGQIYEKVRKILLSANERKEDFGWANIETIAIDSVSRLNALLIKELKKQTGHSPLQIADWGVLYSRIEDLVSLLHTAPFDSITTSGEGVKPDPKDKDEQIITVNLQGGYRDDYFYPYDFILYAEERIRGSTRSYIMHTQTYRGRKAAFRKPESAPDAPKEITNCTFGMIKEMVDSYRVIETQEKK